MAGNEVDANANWKQLVLQYAFQYGFQGVVALILLGAFLGWFENPLTKNVELLQAQAQALAAHVKTNDDMRFTLMRSLELQNMLLRQICVQQAPTNNDRLRCVGVMAQ